MAKEIAVETNSTGSAATAHDPEKQPTAFNPGDDQTPPDFKTFFGLFKPPREPHASYEEAPVLPLLSANVFSKWTFNWINPMIKLGYQRPLESKDLWRMPDEYESGRLADEFMGHYNKRKTDILEWNESLKNGTVKPTLGRKFWWKVRSKFKRGNPDGTRSVGLAWALSDTFFWQFWSAGIIKIIADTLSVTSPLLSRALIEFATQSYYAHRGVPGFTMPGVGKGIGMAFGLFLMQFVAALTISQYFARTASVGVLARGALIAAIYRKSLKLSGKARTVITNGRLVNHLSTDVSRIDFCAGFFHLAYTTFIQTIIIIVLLILQIGPSALAGIGFIIFVLPLQAVTMKFLFKLRGKTMVWTDKRVKLTQELIGGMKIIKFFAWESPYTSKLQEFRGKEMKNLRMLLVIRALNMSIALSIPVLATVVALLVYTGTGHTQNPARIFTTLSLFTLLRMPLMMLPFSLSTITDAYNAIGRLVEVFEAEEREPTVAFNPELKNAIEVEDADFVWESSPPEVEDKKKKKDKKEKKSKSKEPTPTATPPGETEEPLQLRNITLKVPRGQLCAVVGGVGSGKSSLLQALVGEMRKVKGTMAFGGRIAYAPQAAWISNATLRENILFGRPFNQQKYDQVIQDACLEADIDMLPSGDQTEIGEKGINLSGGQKQRVNIARTLYFDSDIILMDDPLSAVDAHVGKHLFEQAIQGALAGKTRVLVTHAVHFLPQVDYIVCIEKGQITQQGTYEELMSDPECAFAKLISDFGGQGEQKEEEEEEDDDEKKEGKEVSETVAKVKQADQLMTNEEKATGTVGGSVYVKFIKAAKGYITVPLLIGSICLMQGAQVLGSYWLVWWQEDHFNASLGFYMGIYAMLGLLSAVFSFFMGLSTVFIGFNASKTLHHGMINNIMRAPMSFFDTTPLGRIMNRFSKDVDTIDNTLNDSMRMFMTTAAAVMGSMILIIIVQHYFAIALVVLMICYWAAMHFYRFSARDLKRLDNLLRSSLYAHFSESISGLATVRAYGETERFLKKNEYYTDLENRAYLLTVINQRWLGFRLDTFGCFLVLAVAIIGVTGRFTITPSQTGLVLSFIMGIQQAISWMVRQFAEVENDMNSVERLLHYTEQVEQEAPAILDSNRTPEHWPVQGAINLNKVVMSYRAGLPPVLKGVTFSVKPNEKIGVVGRTGAGKSSIMMALFRIVELTSGSIEIDGIDISKIGLADLRSALGIIPQEALLFNGTLRSNLDPFSDHDDHVLYNALKRAWLVDQEFDSKGTASSGRFSLDLVIEDEGANLSVGERSLVSLARALVKDSKIIILDEATASVDLRTDALIQETIRKEFSNKTLLCIAHRLRTILSYDRIIVMDAGTIAEFDTPLNLFRADGIFTSMCERSGINEAEIIQNIVETEACKQTHSS